VAHATAGLPDHGALVSAAAHSDCGKVAPTTAAPTATAPTEVAPLQTTTHGKKHAKKERVTAGALTATHGKSGLHRSAVHGKSAGKGKHSH
jgi:hypothetical protein